MAEDDEPSYHHDLGNLSKLEDALNGLSDEANNLNSEGSANAGSSSASRKGNRESKKRVNRAHRDREKALYTRPTSMSRISPPRLVGETIEANVNNGTAEATGEFSNALPQNARRVRPETIPQSVLNASRKPAGVLGTANLPALNNNSQDGPINGLGTSLDFLRNSGGPGRAQDLGKARPVPGASDNNTDLGKHLVQIWEHIRDTLDDIKDLLKEANGGHGGQLNGVANTGTREDKSGDSHNALEDIAKALFPALGILGALLVNKFGPSVAAAISTIQKFAGSVEDAGKNIESKFKDLGSKFENIKNDLSGFGEGLRKILKIPDPVVAAANTTKDVEQDVPRAARAASAVGRGAAAIARGTAHAGIHITKSTAGPAMELTGGIAKTILKPLGAGAGLLVGAETIGHVAGAVNDFRSNNKVGAVTNSMRAIADIEEAGGIKNTLGMLGDAAGLFGFKGASKFLNNFAKTKDGSMINKVAALGIKQVRSRVFGTVAGAAEGAAEGAATGGLASFPLAIGEGVVGFAAPQIIGHEMRRAANLFDNQYNKSHKPTKEEMAGWKPEAATGNKFVDKYLVNPSNWLGGKVDSVERPVDRFVDKANKPFVNALPKNLNMATFQDTYKANLGHEMTNAIVGALNSQLKSHSAGALVAPPTANNNTYTFIFHDSTIKSEADAERMVARAMKSKDAQDTINKRAQERHSNLGLPAPTVSIGPIGFLNI